MYQAVRMAEQAVRQYGTRDPFEIIEARKIRLRYFSAVSLLGYYKVVKRTQYIGLNQNAGEEQQRTAAGHELGHSCLDYAIASRGGEFRDTFLYTLSNGRLEKNANLFAAELLIPDEYILDDLCHDAYLKTVHDIKARLDQYHSPRARFDFEQEQMRQFYDEHEIASLEELGAKCRVDSELIRFKLQALACKGFELPSIPETRNDFLRHWRD